MLQRKLAKPKETTYFGGEQKRSFNDATELQVEANVNQPHDDTEHENEN